MDISEHIDMNIGHSHLMTSVYRLVGRHAQYICGTHNARGYYQFTCTRFERVDPTRSLRMTLRIETFVYYCFYNVCIMDSLIVNMMLYSFEEPS